MSNVIDLAAARVQPDRKTFLGGSDAAAIIGQSRWKTPLRVYLEKRGELAPADDEIDPERQDLLETGKEMEPIIVNRLQRLYGVKVTKRSTPEKPNRYTDPQFPFLAAEVDFEWEVTPAIAARFALPQDLIGTIQNGEAKKVHQFATAQFGEAETEDVPIEYAAQASHGLGVTGKQLTMFAVQLGDDLSVYWIRRDDEIIKPLRARLVKFWNEHVLAGVPPAPINLPDVLEMFKRVPTIRVDATEETYQLLLEMSACKATAKVALERIDELKFELGKFMLGEASLCWEREGSEMKLKPTATCPQGKHELVSGGWPVLSVSRQQQDRISSDAVRTKHPEILPDVTKRIEFFRFDQPRGKKK